MYIYDIKSDRIRECVRSNTNFHAFSRFFSWFPHMYSDSQKNFGTKTQYKNFQGDTLRGGYF